MEDRILKQKRLPKLTKKQRGFVKDYVETENGTQAALNNYKIESLKAETVANAIAVENLQKPLIIEAIEVTRKTLKQALIDKGITEDYLADKVNILLQAEDKQGNKDYTAIDKGLKHATSIYGVVSDDDKPKNNNTYNFIFNPESQASIKEMESKIKAQLIQKHHVQEN